MSSYKLKLLLTGTPGSEKTELLQRFIKKRFAANYKLTVGVDILTKDVEYRPGEFATLSIWDIGRQQRFEFIRQTFYKGAAGAIVVFNKNNKKDFIESISEIREIRESAGFNIPIILIGNNITSDTKQIKENKMDDSKSLTTIEGLEYIESTTGKSDNIEEMFTKITNSIIFSRKSILKKKKKG